MNNIKVSELKFLFSRVIDKHEAEKKVKKELLILKQVLTD